ncbi:MAG: ClbS/DfsB family four-helix bundle protein [Ardenticatenaceae bacterium]|nr:ClbS/DfsB family four-helix bundle protein [Ardenticatenaceae bacterium]
MNELRQNNKRPFLLVGFITLIIVAVTTLVWPIVRFWRRLLRQPLLASLMTASDETADHLEQAYYIAAINVRGAIEERPLPNGRRKLVLNAGWRNFREPWARDFGFASFGLLTLGEERVVKETLEVFLQFQRPNGQFPVKAHSTNIPERYLHSLFERQQPIHAPLRPKYKTAHRTISLDGNALLIIAALNYLRRVNDEAFAHQHWPALKRGLHWLESQALGVDGLLHQGAYTDWADSVKRSGIIHYTNVLYWKALHEFAVDAAKYGYTADQTYFARKADHLKQAINNHFWSDEFGFYETSQQFPHILSSSGNLLAVAWGLASPAQAARILDTMAWWRMAEPVPTQVTNQPYGSAFIAIENRLAGIPHYHTSAAWLWLGAWHVAALVRTERLAEAHTLLERMSQVIARDGVVHEVFGEDGRYLSTRWYTSEAPLTWSASLFIYAQFLYYQATAEGPAELDIKMQEVHMNKTELLMKIEKSREALEAAVARLSEAQLTQTTDNGWAAKDHLAHLAAWEAGIAALLQKQVRQEAMNVDEETFWEEGEEAVNGMIYERNRERPLADILAFFHDSHQQLMAVLAELSDEDLQKTYSHYQPDAPGEDSGAPIVGWVIGNTFEHYELHRPFLEQLEEG